MIIFFILLWICLLIPTISDSHFSIFIKDYNIRLSYLVLATALVLFVYPLIFKRGGRSNLYQTILDKLTSQKFYIFFILFLLTGLASIIFSPIKSISDREHAFFYWMWAVGTILALPYVLLALEHKIQQWFYLLFFIYYLACVLMMLWDTVFIHINQDLTLGGINKGGHNVLRPHLFKKEPGYFAAYWSLAIIYMRHLKQHLAAQKLNSLLKFFHSYTLVWYGLGIFCLLLSVSKMGFLVAAFLLLVEAIYQILNCQKRIIRIVYTSIIAICLLASLSYYFLVPTKINSGTNRITRYMVYIKHHLFQYAILNTKIFFTRELFNAKSIRGFSHPRTRRAEAGFKIFLQAPLLGVGTGLAADYYKKYYPSPPNPALTPSKQPISHNLYTELLSEWGAIGTLLFFLGIYFLFNRAPPLPKLQIYGMLALIYATAETLPRFDIWIYIFMLWHILIYKKYIYR